MTLSYVRKFASSQEEVFTRQRPVRGALRAYGTAILLAFLLVLQVAGPVQSATVPDLGQNPELIDGLLAIAPPKGETVTIDDQLFKVAYLRELKAANEGKGTNSASLTGVTKWPGGVMYYAFDPNVTGSMKSAFQSAAAQWTAAAAVSFVPRTTQSNYVVLTNASVNNSYVGMQGGPQIINIYNWNYVFIICHELAHAFGMMHEQCRSDRDTYVIINTANISSGAAFNFQKQSTANWTSYDFDSVMHYGPTAFSSNGQPTITAQPAYVSAASNMGQRTHLSTSDRQGMASLYGTFAQANLTPAAGSGWSDKIVVSTTTGTNSDSSTLLSTDTLYVDLGILNSGTAAVPATFASQLLVDGTVKVNLTTPAIGAGVLSTLLDYNIGSLSPGTHTLQLVVDSGSTVSESNELDNSYTKTIVVSAANKPNLTPAAGSGWSDKIIVSTTTGTNTDSATLPSTETLYIDLGILNSGTAGVPATFSSQLLIDGVVKVLISTPAIGSGVLSTLTDYNIGSLSAGTHTLRLVVDSGNTVSESDETDNSYTKTIVVTTLPNLTPTAPAGWSDKLVISTVTGTKTDSAALRSTDTLYLDLAIINNSGSNLSSYFTSQLLVDGILRTNITTPRLNAGVFATLVDYNLGTLSGGTHTITLVVDSAGVVAESSESDNSYSKTITVVAPPLITTQPAGPTIDSGQTATLSVTATGTGLTYQWYRGLSGVTTTPVAGSSSSYTTPALSATTNYWVRITNSAGAVNSMTAAVTVRPECALTYLAGQNGTITGATSQTVPYGGSGSAVTAVAAAGHHFVQWSDGSTANPRSDSNVTAPLSVTAAFGVDIYTLSYDAAAHGTLTGVTVQSVSYGGSGTAVNAVADLDYVFVDWSDGSTANPRTEDNVRGDLNVTARFAVPRYTLTLVKTPAAGGSITASPEPDPDGKYAPNTVVTLTAAANPGYVFDSWSGEVAAATDAVEITMAATHTATASFTPTDASLATRALPPTYTPGVIVPVSIAATPRLATTSYVVEETPPTGWSVSAVGQGGTLAAGKVKWGPFADHAARTLTYQATPPAGATGTQTFQGTATFGDEAAFPPDGDDTIDFEAAPRFSLTVLSDPAGAGAFSLSPAAGADGKYPRGTVVTITATGGGAFYFTGFSGDATAAARQVTVTMDADHTVTGSFAVAPTFKAGTYYGLIRGPAGEAPLHKQNGFVTITSTRTGIFTASAVVGGLTKRYRGQFDQAGASAQIAVKSGVTPLYGIRFQLDPDDSTGLITAALDFNGVSGSLAARRNDFNARTNRAPQAGTYTMLLNPAPSAEGKPGLPQGSGAARLLVSAGGMVTVIATLADGTVFSHAAGLASDQSWPLFGLLNSAKGFIAGPMSFDPTEEVDGQGTLDWVKPKTARTLFAEGFTMQCDGMVSAYHNVRKTMPLSIVEGDRNVTFTVTDGDLPSLPAPLPLTLRATGQVINPAVPRSRFALSISLSTGLFSGSFPDPTTAQLRKFQGALFQKQGFAAGFYRGTVETGGVVLGATAP